MPNRAFAGQILWADQPVEFEIRGGVACIRITSGDLDIEVRATISELRKSIRAGQAALAMHDLPPTENVIMFPGDH